MPAKALEIKASKKTPSRTGRATRKNATDNKLGLSGADVEQAALLGAAGSELPESRATSKQGKTASTKGNTASGKSRAGASKDDNKEQQDKVQPRKRREGGAVAASKSAEPDVAAGAAAAADGASVDAEALESNAALQVAPEETNRQGPAPELAAEADEAPHVQAGGDNDEDEAPEEVCCVSTNQSLSQALHAILTLCAMEVTSEYVVHSKILLLPVVSRQPSMLKEEQNNMRIVKQRKTQNIE